MDMNRDMNSDNNNSGNENKSLLGEMLYEIKEALRSEPHSIEEIRRALHTPEVEAGGLLALIERHHDFLQESIVVLLDHQAEGREKQLHLTRLVKLLKMHAQSEQEILYSNLIQHSVQEARLEGMAAQDEHNLAFQLVNELKIQNFETLWTEDIEAKARVLSSLIANHILEEESELFPVVRREMSKEDLSLMATEYIRRCKLHLDEDLA